MIIQSDLHRQKLGIDFSVRLLKFCPLPENDLTTSEES